MVENFAPNDILADWCISYPLPFDATLNNKPSAGAAAGVTMAATAGAHNVLSQIFAACGATPAAGTTVKVEDGSGTTVWEQPLPAAGPQTFNFNPPLRGTVNTALIVTLSAPGGAVQAYLYLNAWRQK